MNDSRTQPQAEAFASIIKMMLAMIRARGLRSLTDLPMLLLAALYLRRLDLRRLGKQFAALMADFKAGKLPPAPPAPLTAPQGQQAARAEPLGTPRVAARPEPGNHRRQRPAVHPAVPAEAAGPRRARPPDCVHPATVPPDACGRPAARPVPVALAVIHRIGLRKNRVFIGVPLHADIVTI
jgi:hypothetical protein